MSDFILRAQIPASKGECHLFAAIVERPMDDRDSPPETKNKGS